MCKEIDNEEVKDEKNLNNTESVNETEVVKNAEIVDETEVVDNSEIISDNDKEKKSSKDDNKSENNHDDEYEEVCFLCKRTESRAGKMVHMPKNICICSDCMQKTFDSMTALGPNVFEGTINNLKNETESMSAIAESIIDSIWNEKDITIILVD